VKRDTHTHPALLYMHVHIADGGQGYTHVRPRCWWQWDTTSKSEGNTEMSG